MIDGEVGGAFSAEDYCESLVSVSHLGVSRGRARVGGTATDRAFAPLAFCEIKTLGFVSHCPRTRMLCPGSDQRLGRNLPLKRRAGPKHG